MLGLTKLYGIDKDEFPLLVRGHQYWGIGIAVSPGGSGIGEEAAKAPKFVNLDLTQLANVSGPVFTQR